MENLTQPFHLSARNHIGLLLICLRRCCIGAISFGWLFSLPYRGVCGSDRIGLERSNHPRVYTSWEIEQKIMLWSISTQMPSNLGLFLDVLRLTGLHRLSRITRAILMWLFLMLRVVLELEWSSVTIWVKLFLL